MSASAHQATHRPGGGACLDAGVDARLDGHFALALPPPVVLRSPAHLVVAADLRAELRVRLRVRVAVVVRGGREEPAATADGSAAMAAARAHPNRAALSDGEVPFVVLLQRVVLDLRTQHALSSRRRDNNSHVSARTDTK